MINKGVVFFPRVPFRGAKRKITNRFSVIHVRIHAFIFNQSKRHEINRAGLSKKRWILLKQTYVPLLV